MGNNNSYYLLIGHWVPGTGLSIPMHYLHKGCGLSSVFSFLVGTAQAALSLSSYFAFSLWIHVPSAGNVPRDSTPPTPHRWEGYPTLTGHWSSAIFCPFFSLSSVTPMGYSGLAFPWTEVVRVRVVRDWTWSRRTLVLSPSDWSKNRELLAFIYPAFLSSQERTALCISHMALCRLSFKPQHPACLLAAF